MKVFRIRPGLEANLHDVVAACFQKGASDYWSIADLAEILALDSCYGYFANAPRAARAAKPLSALIVVKIIADDAEILSLAVRPAYRRAGIARALVGAAMADPQARHAEKWHLEVRADNRAAIKLYESLAFVGAGIRPGYYRDADGGRGDALAMRYGAEA